MTDRTGANLLPVPSGLPVAPALAAAGTVAFLLSCGGTVSWFLLLFSQAAEGPARVILTVVLVLWSMLIIALSALCAVKVYEAVRRRSRVRRWISRSHGSRSSDAPATRARLRTRSRSAVPEARVRRTPSHL